jgi:hypothetical protein
MEWTQAAAGPSVALGLERDVKSVAEIRAGVDVLAHLLKW